MKLEPPGQKLIFPGGGKQKGHAPQAPHGLGAGRGGAQGRRPDIVRDADEAIPSIVETGIPRQRAHGRQPGLSERGFLVPRSGQCPVCF
jgi:hypothetical protein